MAVRRPRRRATSTWRRGCATACSPGSRAGWRTPSPFAFETGPIDYAGDATRFLHGTPAVPALYAARAGHEIVDAVGVDAIRRKSERQVQLLMDLAREHGLARARPPTPSSGAAWSSSTCPHGAAVTRELLRREILVDYRPGAGIRFSPHFYTTDDEIVHAVEETRGILDGGAYRAHEAAGGAGF